MKKRFLTAIQICFVAAVALVLFAGLGRTLFAPKEVNTYENRKANQPPAFSLGSFLATEFQDGFESALSDQVQLSELFKRKYNEIESGISFSVLTSIFQEDPDKSYAFNGLLVRGGDALLYYPKSLSDKAKEAYNVRAEEINSLAASHPELDFYVHYIEKETDISFDSGKKSGHYDYFSALLSGENLSVSVNDVVDFEDYYRRFYKTDHHWNHIGSYEGYLELLPFLGVESEPISADGEFLIGSGMSGSKAAYTRSTGVWVEDMYGYYLNFPWMGVHINGWWSEDYGHQNAPNPDALSYGGYYGDDYGQIVFNMDKPERDNILVIGESYDNAILKLIASHFNKTYSIDLRYYEHYMGEEFDFDSYVAENEIDKVLIIGSVNFYQSEEFSVR